MTPFFPVSHQEGDALHRELKNRGRSLYDYGINCWLDANHVVSGDDHMVETRITMLLMDACTCTLSFLEEAIARCTKEEVDPRILALLRHPYFTHPSYGKHRGQTDSNESS